MILSTKSFGIVPSDVLIEKALIAGLIDLRKNPIYLDFIFQYLLNDDLTSGIGLNGDYNIHNSYGASELQRAKNWFLENKIDVSMNYRIADDIKNPLVTIALETSTEERQTLGDVNYETNEDVDSKEVVANPRVILGPFSPKKYNPATGILTLPDNLTTDNVFPDMALFNVVGEDFHQIYSVLDSSNILLDKNISGLKTVYIGPSDSFYSASIESAAFKQTFKVTCLALKDPVEAIWLHDIVTFLLLKYKQDLLENRGLDNSVLSSGPLYQNMDFKPLDVFARTITISGTVRNYWIKSIQPKLLAFSPKILVQSNLDSTITINQSWDVEKDSIQ